MKEREKGVPTMQISKVYSGTEHPLKKEFPKYLNYEWHPRPTMQT